MWQGTEESGGTKVGWRRGGWTGGGAWWVGGMARGVGRGCPAITRVAEGGAGLGDWRWTAAAGRGCQAHTDHHKQIIHQKDMCKQGTAFVRRRAMPPLRPSNGATSAERHPSVPPVPGRLVRYGPQKSRLVPALHPGGAHSCCAQAPWAPPPFVPGRSATCGLPHRTTGQGCQTPPVHAAHPCSAPGPPHPASGTCKGGGGTAQLSRRQGRRQAPRSPLPVLRVWGRGSRAAPVECAARDAGAAAAAGGARGMAVGGDGDVLLPAACLGCCQAAGPDVVLHDL